MITKCDLVAFEAQRVSLQTDINTGNITYHQEADVIVNSNTSH